MASLTAVNEQLKINNQENMAGHEMVGQAVEKLTGGVNKLLAIMKQSQLDMIEAMREKKDEDVGGKGGDTKIEKPDGLGKIAAIIAAVAALGAGIAAGILDSVKKIANILKFDKLLKSLNTRFTAMITKAVDLLADLFKPLRVFFSADGGFGRFITGIRNTFRMTFTGAAQIIDDLIQPFKTLMSGDGVVGQRMMKLFNGIIDIFKFPFEPLIDQFGTNLKGIFGAGEDGAGFFKRILNSVKAVFDPITDAVKGTLTMIKNAFSIFSEGSALMNTLGTIGRVIGRLFLPFTVIMTAYDTIKGMIAGFEEEGFLGGIKGAFEGLFNSLIGAPLDLLKDAVAWVLSKMGFDESAESLKSFSFSDIITDIINSPIELLKRAFNSLIESIASAIESFDIPFVDEKEAANDLRSFKFEEGMTKSEERKAEAEAEKALDDFEREKNPNKYDKIKARMERRRAGRPDAIGKESRDGLSAELTPTTTGSNPALTVINQGGSGNAQAPSGQTVFVQQHPVAMDMIDPYSAYYMQGAAYRNALSPG